MIEEPRARCRCALAILLGFLGMPSLDAKVASFWEDLTPLRTPRQEVGIAADDVHVYVIGGILADRSATGVVERLDVDANEWEEVAPLPDDTRLHHIGAASAGGRIFAIGGLDGSFRGVRTVWAFDPSSGEWSPKADLPTARGGMGVAVLDDEIYAVGGQTGSTSFDDFAVYHVGEDRWETLAPMPTARNHLAAVALDGVVYAVGGRAGRLFGALEAYDVATARWIELPPMPTPRAGIAAAVHSGRIFVFGGEGNATDPNGIFDDVEGFDVCRNEWERDEPMPHPRHGIGASVIQDRIVIPGGSPVQGFSVTDVVDAYYPGSPLPGGFLRGDSNLDALVDISDPVFTLAMLFAGGEPTRCDDAADANDDGDVDISDAVFGLVFLFLGGTPPPSPGPEQPGFDPTEDALFCDEFPQKRCVEVF